MKDVEQHPHDIKGHHPHVGRGFRIFFALDSLQFRSLSVQDPVPTGRQLIEIAGLDSFDDYSLFAILPSGDFEDIRLNETVDLRARGVERFIAFKTDRDFKFSLRGRQIVWGKPEIDGSDLYFLADVADEQAVFLDVRGGTDRLIEPDDTVDLSEAGIERFVVADKPKPDYIITVNSREHVLDDPNVTYEQIVSFEFQYPPSNPNTYYSMTYRHTKSKPHAGELAAGGSVIVKKKGTVFNVTATDKS